jgi:hypothetical protein
MQLGGVKGHGAAGQFRRWLPIERYHALDWIRFVRAAAPGDYEHSRTDAQDDVTAA